MQKAKWLRADFGIPFERLADRLRANKFDAAEPDGEGFRLEEVKQGRIFGQHIEKESYIHRVSLPSGGEYDEPRSLFTITEFLFKSGDGLAVQLNNPPRKTQTFLNAVSQACDYQFFCDALDVNILAWIKNIEAVFGKCDVNHLDCNSVKISDSTIGRFAFKGVGDVRAEAKKLLFGRECSVESAKCLLRIKNGTVLLQLFRSGAVKFISEPSTDFLCQIENTLSDAIRTK